MSESVYRIGEVAEQTGVTPRTIRYYEELGLLGGSEREKGRHRLYCDSDVERLRELIKLRDLLGVSLDDLRCLLVAEEGDLREALPASRRSWSSSVCGTVSSSAWRTSSRRSRGISALAYGHSGNRN